MINTSQFVEYINASALKTSILYVLARNAESITNNVNKKTGNLVDNSVNNKIIGSKENIIGSKNSFDIVNQNYSSLDLSNAVSLATTNELQNQVEDIYYQEIKAALINSTENVTLEEIRAKAGSQITEMSTKNIELAITEKSNRVFSTQSSNNQFTGILSILSGILGTGFIAEDVDAKYASSISSKAVKEASEFDIGNEGNDKKLSDTKNGFVDPTGSYPTQDYKELPDTNKLAQGEIRGTPLQDRIRNRMLGAKLPNGGSWDQPESSYKAQYPFNKVTQTESGHIIEFDDTPGAERIHIYHRSGTFVEIDPNGSVISRTVGSEYKIVDKNGYIAIAGRANVSINGSCNIHVGGDCNIDVTGDAVINSGNDAQVNAAGRLQLSGGEAIDMRAPKIYIEADEELHIKSEVKTNIETKLLNIKSADKTNIESASTINIKGGENLNIQTEGEFNTKIKGKIKAQSEDDVSIKSGSKFKVQSTGDGSFKFGGNMAMDYATGQFGNNQSTDADDSGPAGSSENAEYSKSGIIEERSPVLEDIIKDPQSLGLVDQYSLLVEDETEDYSGQRQRLIELGLATPNQLDDRPVAGDTDTGSGTSKNDLVTPDINLKKVTYLPDNFQLSPHFTLGMVSSLAAVTKDKVVAQKGLRYGDIVYNLQNLALNVLEPIYAVYPNMLVTSGFRTAESSSGTSQHPSGKAVDIQFRGMRKDEYYATAKKLKECVQFDQFLLEYCNYTNNPWIHISLNSETYNRNQISTFWNHKKYGDGLTDLA